MKKKPNITACESLLWTCSVVVVLREDTVLLQLRSCAGVCESSYNPQVKQHCFWTDLREQRPNSFNLSQKREDMEFFLQTGPARGERWLRNGSKQFEKQVSCIHLTSPCSPRCCTFSVFLVWKSSHRGCLALQQNPPR